MLKYISAPIYHAPESATNPEYCGGPFRYAQVKAHLFEKEEEATEDAKRQCLKSTELYGVYALITQISPPEVLVTSVGAGPS